MIEDSTEIPWQELDVETLDKLLSEIVTRDGTDYGLVEKSTEQKISAARKSLQNKSSMLYWNPETETAALVSADKVNEEKTRYAASRARSGITTTSTRIK